MELTHQSCSHIQPVLYGLRAIFVEKKVSETGAISYRVYNDDPDKNEWISLNTLNDIYNDSGEHFSCAYGIDK